MTSTDWPSAIDGYGLIGDCGAAALVSEGGSIDWLCLPRFDSDPIFGRLLDPCGGHFVVTAAEPATISRRYLPDTGVLATTFRTPGGEATVHDFFAAIPRADKRSGLWPFRYLVRRVAGEEGVVRFDVEVAPRDAFRRRSYRLQARGCRLAAARSGRAALFEASLPWRVRDGVARTAFDVGPGEVRYVTMAYAGRDLGVWPPTGAFAETAFERTKAYWRDWACREDLGGRAPEMVRRSAIVLKMLSFAPSGGVIAAPTTSLPEALGGARNWDYRYVWVRDASWAVAALNEMGYSEEARAYLFWAANAARLTQPRVHTMYTLYGSHRAPERELDWLRGYGDSRPVRVGNAAVDQLQLDTWGHLVDAAHTHVHHGGPLDEGTWSSMSSFVQFAADNWRRPDQGMWEVRGAPRHFVHSKVMCWVALDRGVRLVRHYGFRGPADRWARERDRVKEVVLRDGVDREHGNLMRAFDDPGLDASLLLVPTVGFLPGDDERMVRTIDRIRDELGTEELIHRYRCDDGLPGSEGAFVACSFWLAHALALAGQIDEACDVFERTCRRANHLGLLPEEIDADTGTFLGNFPQGLSHIALVNAAAAIRRAEEYGPSSDPEWVITHPAGASTVGPPCVTGAFALDKRCG